MEAKSSMDPQRRGPHFLALSYLALFALLVVAAAAITVLGDSHAGDPVVAIDISPSGSRFAPRVSPAQDASASAPMGGPAISDAEQSNPPAVTRRIYAGQALLADPALVENTSLGPLPRIAGDGTTPMRAYAPGVADGGRPRIAIVIAGLGTSARQTEAALKGLPPGVTLAFSPYSAEAQHWVALARQQGHEVLLEVPMEPFDFPDSDPGPHTLRSGVGEDANAQRLIWSLTRFTGYAGTTNLQGGRFLADSASLEPVLTYLARRGLMFFDNGRTADSAAADLASRTGVAFARSDAIIDSVPSAVEIDRNLSTLEAAARAQGHAAGSGRLYPVTIDRVSRWARELAGRGFVLVPASAIVATPN
jgi:polysaccharide deacetylase 2 family uncharacterized protein YibQ